jgi:hypothetical protein
VAGPVRIPPHDEQLREHRSSNWVRLSNGTYIGLFVVVALGVAAGVILALWIIAELTRTAVTAPTFGSPLP